MSMKTRKHNADHGTSLKKALTFSSPPPIEPTIANVILQANEAKAHFKEESYSKASVANADNDVDFNNAILGGDIFNDKKTQTRSLSPY